MATRKFKRITVGEVRSLMPTSAGKPPKKTVEQFASTTLKSVFASGDKIRAQAIKIGLIENTPSSAAQDAERAARSAIHTGLAQNKSAAELTKAINDAPEVYLYFTLMEGLQESVESEKTKTVSSPKVESSSARGSSRPAVLNRVNNRQRKVKQERVAEPRLPQQTMRKPQVKNTQIKSKGASQIKSKYPYDTDVWDLARDYAGKSVFKANQFGVSR
jgi:hypothetical protein